MRELTDVVKELEQENTDLRVELVKANSVTFEEFREGLQCVADLRGKYDDTRKALQAIIDRANEYSTNMEDNFIYHFNTLRSILAKIAKDALKEGNSHD